MRVWGNVPISFNKASLFESNKSFYQAHEMIIVDLSLKLFTVAAVKTYEELSVTYVLSLFASKENNWMPETHTTGHHGNGMSPEQQPGTFQGQMPRSAFSDTAYTQTERSLLQSLCLLDRQSAVLPTCITVQWGLASEIVHDINQQSLGIKIQVSEIFDENNSVQGEVVWHQILMMQEDLST